MFPDRAQVFGGTTRFLALIELIYSAANDATLWLSILDQMGEAVGGEQTLLFAPPPIPVPQTPFAAFAQLLRW
jgi:hypothetical protein